MAQASGKMVEVGIVLQGGGALGAYECGALNALLELMDELESQGCPIVLKAISGVSIGAINDACVVGSTDRPGGARRQARSAEPVRRREAGHDIARRRLLPVFEGCGLVSTKEITAAPARS